MFGIEQGLNFSMEVESDASGDSWVDWFHSLRGSDLFCKIDKEYLGDKFNLTGLGVEVGTTKKAYQLILDEYGK